jgi:ADP-heptose:LPS heptosyltransferase
VTRVLLVRLSAMGDVVQSLGAAASLHAARPELEIHMATQTTYAPLLRGAAGVHGVVEHDRRGGVLALWRTARAVRRLRCEVAVDLQGNAKSALLTAMSGAADRLGAAAQWRQEPWSRWLLRRTIRVDGPRHPGLVAWTLVRALAPEAPWVPPRLVAEPGEVERALGRVRALGVDPRSPFRVVSVGDERDPRSQRAEALTAEVRDAPLPVLLLLGPREAGAPIPPGVPVWRQEAGELRQLVALGALLRRCGGDAVGPDHGPTHVLAAAGARTTALFGPQDPARTAPPEAMVVQSPSPPPCMPCRSRRCRHADGPVCMAFASAQGRAVPRPSWLPASPP